MTKPQMMICPKAKECKKCPNPHHKYPHELIVAGYSDACDDLRGGCPACIPVEPKCEALGCDNTATETLISSVCPSITFNLCPEHAKSQYPPLFLFPIPQSKEPMESI